MTENEILLTSILNCARSELYSSALSLNHEQAVRFISARRRRSLRIPLQYILGETEFFGLVFKVDQRVLIPRPETEIIVEEAIRQIKNGFPGNLTYEILDLGTGSGCIAVSLARNLAQGHITAVDISPSALEIAKENARINRVSQRIDFRRGDLFAGISYDIPAYDMIVSNPPYISTDDFCSLEEEVKHEPRLALDGGKEGLDFYPPIIRGASRLLKTGGLLLLEMGFKQSAEIKKMFGGYDNLEVISIVKDYNGIDRVIAARKINF